MITLETGLSVGVVLVLVGTVKYMNGLKAPISELKQWAKDTDGRLTRIETSVDKFDDKLNRILDKRGRGN